MNIPYLFNLMYDVTRKIGDDSGRGINCYAAALFVFVIGNKINELAIFIQRSIDVGHQRFPELSQRQLSRCPFEYFQPNTHFKIGKIFTDIGLRHA
ncbi:hypothetical protein D3C86_1902000 [compost metagenome]